MPPSTPGLYGNDSVLLVDVSHLPRLDQYDAMAIASGEAAMPDQLSDVKTVTYFVNNRGMGSPAGGTSAADVPADQQSGLVRRELDRAVAVWSEQQGLGGPPAAAGARGRPDQLQLLRRQRVDDRMGHGLDGHAARGRGALKSP